MCVSIGLSLGEAWGAWKPHLYKSITQKLFFIAQFGTISKFRGHGSINKNIHQATKTTTSWSQQVALYD